MSAYNLSYLKTIKALELWLNFNCKNKELEDYMLSDLDFLERYARLKYQINKDDLFSSHLDRE